MVAGVEVRGVGRLVLALEDPGDPRREAAERLVRRVDDVPAALDLALARCVGLRGHRFSVFSVSTRRPSEDDSTQTQAVRRGTRPVEGRPPGAQRRSDRCRIHLDRGRPR